MSKSCVITLQPVTQTSDKVVFQSEQTQCCKTKVAMAAKACHIY